MRTTAATRPPEPGALTGQQALDAILCLLDIYGQPFDGQRALRILAIARQHGIKAEGLHKGLLRVRPAGSGYILEIK